MEELVNLVVNNGLGVASFVALIIFIFYYMKSNQEQKKEELDVLNEIKNTMTSVNENIYQLNERVSNLENKE